MEGVGGGGVKTPLGRYQSKSKKGFFSKGSILGGEGEGGGTAFAVVSH